MAKSDVADYMKFLDKSFEYVDHGKSTKFEDYQKVMKGFLGNFTDVKVTIVPLKVVVNGDEVTVSHHYTFTGTGKGGSKKVLRFFQDGTDTWKKVGNQFLQTREAVEKEGMLPAAGDGKSG